MRIFLLDLNFRRNMTSIPPSEESSPPGVSHSYPRSPAKATLALQEMIHDEIQQNGSIAFPYFMELALYHSEWGYYTKGSSNVGKDGDFFTSVSVGSAFGAILAHRIHQEWQRQQKPNSFHIIEMGANDGQLAKDILDTIQITFPELYQSCLFHIVEPLHQLRANQEKTTANHSTNIIHHHTLSELQSLNGVFLSNELIDAFPVHLIEYTTTGWKEKKITHQAGATPNSFTWKHEKLSTTELQNFTQSLPLNYPLGYTTEYRPNIRQFAHQISQALTTGITLTIDYGYTRANFYHPSRTTGTLRTYKNHQAGEDPLSHIGEQDITAHVDFTQLAQAYSAAGFHMLDFSQQARYLTKHGSVWLLHLEENPNSKTASHIRQFQTLIHPSMLGSRFFVLETSTYPSHQEQQTKESLEWL